VVYGEPFQAIAGFHHTIAFQLQRVSQEMPYGLFVVNNQNLRHI
jgi:hypothetical protein